MQLRYASASVLAFLSAACIPPAPEPSPAPSPTPVIRTAVEAPPAPPAPAVALDQASDWLDRPLTPGNWSYRQMPGSTEANFGSIPASAEPQLSIRCERASRNVELAVRSEMRSPLPITVRTETADRSLPVRLASTDPRQITAALAASDPLLDAMAFSNGRFAVTVAGARALVVPAWPEITRVIEDCRS